MTERYRIGALLEIVFWKATIQMMSWSHKLLVLAQPVFDTVLSPQTKKVLLRSAALAGSGLTLGFMFGFLRAILR
jgi:hypothetical protein